MGGARFKNDAHEPLRGRSRSIPYLATAPPGSCKFSIKLSEHREQTRMGVQIKIELLPHSIMGKQSLPVKFWRKYLHCSSLSGKLVIPISFCAIIGFEAIRSVRREVGVFVSNQGPCLCRRTVMPVRQGTQQLEAAIGFPPFSKGGICSAGRKGFPVTIPTSTLWDFYTNSIKIGFPALLESCWKEIGMVEESG